MGRPSARGGLEGSDVFFAAVASNRMPMVISDPRRPDDPLIFVNEAFTAMTGYGPEEILGRNCRFLQGPETDRSVVARLGEAVRAGREIHVEILNYRRDGSPFWNALFVSPVHDRAGRLLYHFGSQMDVTARRDAEAALHHAGRMDALGRLTGGVAHDFGNLLQALLGHLSLAEAGLTGPRPDLGKVERALGRMRVAAEHGAALTAQLRAFARKQPLSAGSVDLNEIAASVADLAGPMLGVGIAVRTRLSPALGRCRLDRAQLEIALLNLLLNARDAMPAGGVVTVSTEEREVGGEGDGLAPGRYVALEVADSGEGIAPENLRRVLEPFFTTKPEGAGTGLGLSTAYGFAAQSGGALRLRSELGAGTTVTLLFPEEAPAP